MGEPSKLEGLNSKADGNQDEVEETEDVTSYDSSSMRKRKAEPLVIPLIKRNFYNSQDNNDKAAAAELLSEAKTLNEEREKDLEEGNEGFSNLIVDMMANREGARETTDENGGINVDLRPESSKIDDYDRIPVNGFGMAMLRGMGFEKEKGIGRTFKQSIKPIEVNLRPKGLGLGATPMSGGWSSKQGSKDSDDEAPANADPKVGHVVEVMRGPHKGTVGKMVGFDDDTSRILIKCSESDSVLSVPVISVQVRQNEDSVNGKPEATSDSVNKSNGVPSNSYKHKTSTEINGNHSDSRSHSDSKSENNRSSSSRKELKEEAWLMGDIVVRVIDKTISKGRYYKEKVRVVDVITPYTCDCRTKNGTLLESVAQSSLETVIPKLSSESEVPFVKIVRGRKRGLTAEVISVNKDRCKLEALIIDMVQEPVQLSFDDVCQLDTKGS